MFFKMEKENKQYGVSFELATYIQTRLHQESFPIPFVIIFEFLT
jgi:hypothetical protein